MIIVSQDKKRITKSLELFVDKAIGEYYGVLCQDKREITVCLGYYKTEERAKEVLKEIIETYQMSKFYETSVSSEIQFGLVETVKKSKLDLYCYEMPEE